MKALVAMCMIVSSSASLHAQTSGVSVSARAGIAVPSEDYNSSCGDPGMAFSLDVVGRRQVFPQISLDHFSGSGGGDDLCGVLGPDVGTLVGGLRVDGSTRLGLGVGARVGDGQVQLEGVLQGGIIRGQHGFVASADDDSRHVMPHIGGQGSLILFRFVVLSAAANWTRLSREVIPPSGGTGTTRTNWSPMTTWQVGVRVPPEG